MQLSLETITGLKRLCNSTLISDQVFAKLIENCCKNDSSSTDLANELEGDIKVDIVKTAYSSLVTLFVEGVRQNIDPFMMKCILEGYNLDQGRIIKVCEAFKQYRGTIQTKLLMIGTNAPHIIDVHWRLDYPIKADNKKCFLEPIFYIDLVTMSSNNVKEIVRFAATVQNMEELVFQLKTAVRHVTRFGHMLK